MAYDTPHIDKKPKSIRYYQEGVPEVDPRAWRLALVDLLGCERRFGIHDILRLPQVTERRRMVCVCNWTVRRWWHGVLLADLLHATGLEAAGDLYLRQTSIGTDSGGVYQSTIPLASALARRAMLVHAVDGAPLSPDQGFPLRLMDFGLYGYKGVKGLARLEIVRDFEAGFWESRFGYAKEGEILGKRYYVVDRQTHLVLPGGGEVMSL